MSVRNWVELLESSLRAEWGTALPVAALATCDEASRPRVRHVVCRRVNGDGRLVINSDARSEKVSHLRLCNEAELAFYLPNRLEQYRIACTVDLEGTAPEGALRLELWRELSDATRATFFWPAPGMLRDGEMRDFHLSAGQEEPVPETFEVMVLTPIQVELLEIGQFPHRRRRWSRATGWSAVEINP